MGVIGAKCAFLFFIFLPFPHFLRFHPCSVYRLNDGVPLEKCFKHRKAQKNKPQSIPNIGMQIKQGGDKRKRQ
jgi:DNA primase